MVLQQHNPSAPDVGKPCSSPSLHEHHLGARPRAVAKRGVVFLVSLLGVVLETPASAVCAVALMCLFLQVHSLVTVQK